MADKEHWTVDRKIPLALVLTIVLQTAGALWWASKLESRVQAVEVKTATDSVRLDAVEKAGIDTGKSIAHIEERLIANAEASKRIEAAIDRLNDKLDGAQRQR